MHTAQVASNVPIHSVCQHTLSEAGEGTDYGKRSIGSAWQEMQSDTAVSVPSANSLNLVCRNVHPSQVCLSDALGKCMVAVDIL